MALKQEMEALADDWTERLTAMHDKTAEQRAVRVIIQNMIRELRNRIAPYER